MKVWSAVLCAPALAATQALAHLGDDVPSPLPVLNVSIEESDYGFGDAQAAAQAAASQRSLASLASLQAASRSGLASLFRGNTAKIGKAHAVSFLEAAPSPISMSMDDPDVRKTIDSELERSCGKECVSMWDAMLSRQTANLAPGETPSWGKIMQNMATEEYSRMLSELEGVQKSTTALSSFAEMKSKLLAKSKGIKGDGFSSMLTGDAPCFDATSCKIVEVLANKCNFGRVSSLATYNAVNMAAHVFGIVANVLCGCVHVLNQSACILKTQPFCEFTHTVFDSMLSTSTKVWGAVKASTDVCSTVGDARIAS